MRRFAAPKAPSKLRADQLRGCCCRRGCCCCCCCGRRHFFCVCVFVCLLHPRNRVDNTCLDATELDSKVAGSATGADLSFF